MTLFIPLPTAAASSIDKAVMDKAIADALAADQRTLVLPSLAAGVWTDFPSAGGRTIAGFQVLTDAGETITDAVDTRKQGDIWQVRSLVALSNVQINVEY